MTEQPQLTKGAEPVEYTAEAPAAPQPAPSATELPASAGEAAGLDVVTSTAPRDRRVLRAVLRWTAAVVVFAAVGTASAYGITRAERTDLPGLATASDGRWDYPELTLPPLPSGSPAPADAKPSGTHYADLRALLLPAPAGATEDKSLRGSDGWLPTSTFLAEFSDAQDRAEFGRMLADAGLRHIAARGWTAEDGTRSRIYLLHFGSAEAVDEPLYRRLFPYAAPTYPVRGADTLTGDDDFPLTQVRGVERMVYVEKEPYGPEQVGQAVLAAGDVLAVVIQSRKGGVGAVPFQQTVVLQSQLLS